METNISKFYLPRRIMLSLIIVAVWAQVFWFVFEFSPLIIIGILVNIALPLIIVWGTNMSISNEGIALYHFNKLVWPDIVDAQQYKVAGLSYVRIKRKEGVSWALPLYFVGKNTIKEAVLSFAPKNNPLYKVASEIQNT